MSALPLIPFDEPRPRRAGDAWDEVKTGLDFVAHNLPRYHRLLVRINPYPRPWQGLALETPDGAGLAAWFGPGLPGAPAILMVPGTFQTKDDTPRKRRALDLWRRFGAHVLIFDQRGFGGSHEHPGTAGFLESRDLHVAADWLRAASRQPRVHVWGESLGGAVSLVAGALPGAGGRFASVAAWSPFAELSDAIHVGSRSSRRGRGLVGGTYRWLLRRRLRGEVRDFAGYLRLQAEGLGVAVEDLLVAGSPVFHVEDLQVPAYVFHARDDPIVPVTHARLLERAARERAPRLDVTIVPRGGHLNFDRLAPRWYRHTTQALYGAPPAAPAASG